MNQFTYFLFEILIDRNKNTSFDINLFPQVFFLKKYIVSKYDIIGIGKNNSQESQK